MRYILASLISVCAFFAQAQQINPVPDYVFGNRMSVGRTSVTDTAAYFSVGPRYGAIRGMMPPMVVDTALVSGNKRNGLLIFSVQKNKFVYWDSVGSKWAEMAGTGGTAINSGDTAAMLLPYLRKADTTAMLAPYLKESDTVWLSNRVNLKVNISDTATMLAPYLKESDTAFLSNRINLKVNISDTSSMLTNYVRHAGYGLTKSGQSFLVDTAAMATRARVQKGIDSVASIAGSGFTGSGTTNYVVKFTGTKALGNSLIQDNGTNLSVGVSPTAGYRFYVRSETATSSPFYSDNGTNTGFLIKYESEPITNIGNDFNRPLGFLTNNAERARIHANGNIGIGTTTDAGYKTDIAGTLRTTLGANFATTSGNVGIGTASPNTILTVAKSETLNAFTDYLQLSDNTNGLRFSNYFDVSGIRWDLRRGTTTMMAFNPNNEVLIGTTSDAGAYALQVAGSIYNTTGAVLAASSGNVGVGTTTPQQKFVVSNAGAEGFEFIPGQSSNVNQLLSYNRSTSVYSTLVTRASIYNIQIGTDNAMYIDASRNVGIGTVSPAEKLHINSGALRINGVDGTFSGIYYYTSTSNAAGRNWGTFASSQTFGDFDIRQSNAKDGNPLTSGTSMLYINPSGEILLAGASDAGDYKLQVNGNERIAGKLDVITTTEYAVNVGRTGTSATGFQAYNSTAAMAVGIESSAGGGLFTGTSAYAAVFGNANNYPTQFITNNTLRATISAAGELLVGTTSDQGDYNIQTNNAIYAAGNAAGVGVLVGSDKSIETTGVNLNINANQGGAGLSTISMKLTSATPAFTFSSDAVLMFGTNTYSTMTNGLTMKNGTAPTGSATDQFHMYSADITAGNAAPHFRTENNAVIKLYQETTGVAAASFTANSGTAVNDASTFDGYTLKQVVKALRNLGILQ